MRAFYKKEKTIVRLFASLFLLVGLFTATKLVQQKQNISKKAVITVNFDNCKSTSSTDFSSCWDTARINSCAYIYDTESKTVDTANIFCNGSQGLCKYKGAAYTCQGKVNPVQDAVDKVSSKNLQAGRLKYEVYLEPGNFTVEIINKDGGPETNGFKRYDSSGAIVENQFAGERFGVQIPSWTKISGVRKDNVSESYFYISTATYENFRIQPTEENPKPDNSWIDTGTRVQALFYLTNIKPLHAGSDRNAWIAIKTDAVNNFVHDVDINNLYYLGVGSRELVNQVPSNDPDLCLCVNEPCKYKYTARTGIRSAQVGKPEFSSKPNVKITDNNFRMFGWFMFLGYIFNQYSADMTISDLDGDGVRDHLGLYGGPSDRVIIGNNTMQDAWAADSVISIGSRFVDYIGNTVKNGWGGWPGNQIALSAFMDSRYVRIMNNTVDNYLTGVNLESGYLANTSRYPSQNIVINNTFKNMMMNCVSVLSQDKSGVFRNSCTANIAKNSRVRQEMNYAFFCPQDKIQCLGDITNNPNITYREAQKLIGEQMGSGFLLYNSRNSIIALNNFYVVPRGMYLSQSNPYGLLNNVVKQNTFALSGEDANDFINFATLPIPAEELNSTTCSSSLNYGEGLSDTYYTFIYSGGTSTTNVNGNKLCSDNSFQYPDSRKYSIPSVITSTQITKNANCSTITTSDVNGWFDSITGNKLLGWSCDKKFPDNNNFIDVEIVSSAGLVKQTKRFDTNSLRETAVATVCTSLHSYHGFSIDLNNFNYVAGDSVKVYGIGFDGSKKLLTGSPKLIPTASVTTAVTVTIVPSVTSVVTPTFTPVPPTVTPVPTVISTSTPTPSTANSAPYFTTTALANGYVGTRYYRPVYARDLNSSNVLSMTMSNLPSGLSLVGCTQYLVGTIKEIKCYISGVPTRVETRTVTATVRDGITSAVRTYILKVTD